jgi:IS30 family transposase
MPGKHINSFERGQIQGMLELGTSRVNIAKHLGRSPSTIGREIDLNSTPQGYDAGRAQELYEERRKPCRPKNKLDYAPLLDYVKSKIRDEEWAPETIAIRLPLDFPDDVRMRVSHETLYREIYTRHDLRFLKEYLAQSRPKRRKRGQGKISRGPSIPNRVGIEQRPAHIEERSEPGHWEADTIFGKNQDSFLVTLVERSARILRAVEVFSKHADIVANAITGLLIELPRSWVKTITFDNGTEFAQHEKIAAILNVDTYFATPYCSWQRGTNENTNGLIRRYLPKGTCFKTLHQNQLQNIVQQLNNRPRKCLNARTPNEVFEIQRQNHQIALRA